MLWRPLSALRAAVLLLSESPDVWEASQVAGKVYEEEEGEYCPHLSMLRVTQICPTSGESFSFHSPPSPHVVGF